MDKKKIALLALGHLSNDVNSGALPAALPYVRAAHALDYQATGGLMMAYSCLSSIIQPLFGLWADRLSKPWFIPLGVALAGCGIAAMGFMANYWAIFFAITISGVGSALFHPEGARCANRVAGKSKGAALSIFSIGGNTGFILGPLLVTFFVGRWGLSGMSAFAALGLATAILLLWAITRQPPERQPAHVHDDAALAKAAAEEGADPAGAEALEAEETPKPGVNDWREFSKLTAVIVARSITFVGFSSLIPLYWANVFGQSAAAGGLALAFFCTTGVCFNMAGGLLSDRIGCVSIIRLAFSIMPLVVFAFSFITRLWLAWAILPLLGFVLYAPFSSQVVLGQTLLARNIGFASGVTLGLATTLGGIAQPLLGYVADQAGLPWAIRAIGCACVVGAAFSWLLEKRA